jgi:UDP-hydrolysing UDP-N-acetyl-D-glucosamine 2-epimerase
MTLNNTAKRRRICVILVDRANYGRLKPVMHAIHDHPQLELQVVAAGTMPLERFGRASDVVRRDGFTIDGEVLMELEGSMPLTMAKSVGFGVIEFASEFQRLNPDIILLIGDRYEALAAALAAAFMNKCIVHLQGGEVSGSIDESTRHAISKFAQYHVPATRRAADYLVRMGEHPRHILSVGCPSSDIARTLQVNLTADDINAAGSGARIDPVQPFLLVLFHPVTTAFGGEGGQMQQLLEALAQTARPTLLLWPNIDAGADHISKTIRRFREQNRPSWLRVITNLQPETYLQVLARTTCAIGNSSSFVRDAGYFGTPVVLVGDRQNGREHDVHVRPVGVTSTEILKTIRAQLEHGRYAPSTLYGDGYVSGRIAEALVSLQPYVQKRLAYVQTGAGAAQ